MKIIMLSAMYENGGNTTHRFLDGHPELFVYPFESQVGTRLINDQLASMFPVKYRWPVFALDATAREDFRAIIDEECKVRARTPLVSKFRNHRFDLDDDARCRIYERLVAATGRSTGATVAAYFRATFEAWTNARRSGRESVYVGYSPIVTVDADKILRDLPGAHVLHVVRNPWSAYADTCRRPVPLSLADYMLGWVVTQHHARLFRALHPDGDDIVRIEDVMRDPAGSLAPVCGALGLEPDAALDRISWNGTPLDELRPWGTIREPTPEANRRAAGELTARQRDEIRERARPYLEHFDYQGFLAP